MLRYESCSYMTVTWGCLDTDIFLMYLTLLVSGCIIHVEPTQPTEFPRKKEKSARCLLRLRSCLLAAPESFISQPYPLKSPQRPTRYHSKARSHSLLSACSTNGFLSKIITVQSAFSTTSKTHTRTHTRMHARTYAHIQTGTVPTFSTQTQTSTHTHRHSRPSKGV